MINLTKSLEVLDSGHTTRFLFLSDDNGRLGPVYWCGFSTNLTRWWRSNSACLFLSRWLVSCWNKMAPRLFFIHGGKQLCGPAHIHRQATPPARRYRDVTVSWSRAFPAHYEISVNIEIPQNSTAILITGIFIHPVCFFVILNEFSGTTPW